MQLRELEPPDYTSAWTDTHELRFVWVYSSPRGGYWIHWCVYDRQTGQPLAANRSYGLDAVLNDVAEFGFTVNFVEEADASRVQPTSPRCSFGRYLLWAWDAFWEFIYYR